MNLFKFLVLYLVQSSPNQKKVFDGIDRNNSLYDYHPYEKITQKISYGPYPEDQIQCQDLEICQLCNAQQGYKINNNNIHLIGLHYGYKQQINTLYDQLKNLYIDEEIYFTFQDHYIYKENLLTSFNEKQKIEYPFSQVIQMNRTINLQRICLKAWLNERWYFNIAKMNYTTECFSHLIQCDQIYEESINSLIIISGSFLSNNSNLIEIQKNKNISVLKIIELTLPNEQFDQLLLLFFGPRFIELIDYENKTYQIRFNENKTDKNLELELTMEIT